ncbi:MAG TPA: hypothetical protein DCG57_15385 [Candidatus Riflebacteria bacterium]|jgi:hypothetical protein|nr:hypothetical protein [Candidatus Riflebacteria bacterium]
MPTIDCLHCKQKTDECPECKGALEQHVILPVVILIIALLLMITNGYRWHLALKEHDKAQGIRQAYIKKNPEAFKKLR